MATSSTRFDLAKSTIEQFVDFGYQYFLNRPADAEGRAHALKQLAHGQSRPEFIKSLVSSPEYFALLQQALFGQALLPELTKTRPANYRRSRVRGGNADVLTFQVASSADYDWLEDLILQHGYYERPGVWSLAIDTDKHVTAEIACRFHPNCCLEIGCSTGAVIKLLDDENVYAEGVEISHLAVALSYPSIRRRIHFGDLLALNLDAKYDLILGMDVFEHMNPNKLDAYVQCCYDLLRGGGFLFTNIPAFGGDRVFGEVFPVYLEDWLPPAVKDDEAPFSCLHVDDAGWPLNGHLIWATTTWWQRTFEKIGFVREAEIEKALHKVYDNWMAKAAPARRSFYVFSKQATSITTRRIVESIESMRFKNAHA
jgi:SAM-dependent methyltransferase